MKDTLLFINNLPDNGLEEIKQALGEDIKIAIIGDSRKRLWLQNAKEVQADFTIPVQYNKPLSIARALRPYYKSALAISCRGDRNIPDFAAVLPHVPYLKTPTSASLAWASDKYLMRQRFHMYDESISPQFAMAKEYSDAFVKKVSSTFTFPVIVKPANLNSSLLVMRCDTKTELQKTLRFVFNKIEAIYTEQNIKASPSVVVEEFIGGEKYSIDAYVNAIGQVECCPLVYIQNGDVLGFDDFFEFKTSNVINLSSAEKKQARVVARKAVRALGLRSSSAHIELIQSKHGWKVVEVGARLGGYRQQLYKLGYDIDHALNDVRVRLPEKVVIPKKRKQYVGVFNFYAKNEGRLRSIKGIRNAQKLPSYIQMRQTIEKGEMCRFAKNGGKKVIEIWLAHKDLTQWKEDVKKLEKTIEVVTI